MHTYRQTGTHTHTHVYYTHTYIHTYIHMYITHIHTYIHTYIRTHTHTQTRPSGSVTQRWVTTSPVKSGRLAEERHSVTEQLDDVVVGVRADVARPRSSGDLMRRTGLPVSPGIPGMFGSPVSPGNPGMFGSPGGVPADILSGSTQVLVFVYEMLSMYVYIYVFMRVGVHACAHVRIHHTARHIHTYTYTCKRELYVHTDEAMHPYIYIYIYIYIHKYINVYTKSHKCAGNAPQRPPTYIHAHIHTYIHAHIHTYIHAYVQGMRPSKVLRAATDRPSYRLRPPTTPTKELMPPFELLQQRY
jgi:hypothetical protein